MVKNLHIYSDKNINIDKQLIHKLVNRLKGILNFEVSSLIINFIHAEMIHEINYRYLKHDFTTDIITFNYSGNHKILDGELFISKEDCLFNAKKFRVPLIEEYLRLVIHGILHLLNYDDQNKIDKLVMKRLENKFVKICKNELLNGTN